MVRWFFLTLATNLSWRSGQPGPRPTLRESSSHVCPSASLLSGSDPGKRDEAERKGPTRTMKVVHVVSHISRRAAGVGEVVKELAKAQASLGLDVSIVTLRDSWFEQDAPNDPLIRILGARPLGPSRVGFSKSLERLICGECVEGSIIHSHGIWMYPQLAARRAAEMTGTPLVVSPHGMLEGWALKNGSRLKRITWACWEGTAFHRAAMVHVMSSAEAESVRRVTANRNIVVIPPGVHAPAPVTVEDTRSLMNRLGTLGRSRVLLFLSRLHKKKGLDLLIGAWEKLAVDFRDWTLVVAGPETDGSGEKAQAEIRNAGLFESVVFTGEVNRRECNVLLDLAEVFVLPTRSENFGMVVAESLAAARPVLTTTETPWGEIESVGCGWIVKPTLEDVTEGLRRSMSLPTGQLRLMGESGRRWVTARFSWPSTAERMVEKYKTLAGRDK